MFAKTKSLAGALRSAGCLSLILILSACGGGGGTVPPLAVHSVPVSPLPANPVPAAASMSPATVAAGGGDFTLTVTGTNFVSGAEILWSGSALATTFVSSTQLTALVPAWRIASPGTVQIQVSNPAPGGGTSTMMSLQVENGVPTLSTLSPGTTLAGSPSLTLVVDGSNFVSGATVSWDGSPLTTTFVSDTRLTAEVSASRIQVTAARLVAVTNPAPGGGTSASASFQVSPVQPRFAYSAEPAFGLITKFVTGKSSGELRYNGYHFTGGSWNGPHDLLVSRSRRYLYANNFQLGSVSAYEIDANDGSITLIGGAPVAAGSGAWWMIEDPAGRTLYVTNYNDGTVSALAIDAQTGALSQLPGSPYTAGVNPGQGAMDPLGKFLYVPSYGSDVIFAFNIDSATGALTPVLGSPFPSSGSGPWGASVDPSGGFLIVTNENDVNVSLYQIDQGTGALTNVAGSPFAVGVYPQPPTFDASGRFVYFPDFTNGNQGYVYGFSFDASTGAMTPVPGSPFASGFGVMSLSLDNSLNQAFVVNYRSWEVQAFDVDPVTGTLVFAYNRPIRQNPYEIVLMEGSSAAETTPKFAYFADSATNNIAGYAIDPNLGMLSSVGNFATGANPSAVVLDPRGRFAFIANTGSNSVMTYSVDGSTGALTNLPSSGTTTGASPVALAIDPAGRFLFVACQGNNRVEIYTIDSTTGALSAAGFAAAGTTPTALAIGPTGQYLYVVNSGSNDRQTFSVNLATGALTQVYSQSTNGLNPRSIAMDPFFRYLYVANFDSGTIVQHGIQHSRGLAGITGTTVIAGKPSSVIVDPSGRFAYVTDFVNNTVLTFSIGPGSATLTLVGTVVAGTGPVSATLDPSGKFLYVTNTGSQDITIYEVDQASGALTVRYTMSAGQTLGTGAMVSAMQ